MKFLIDLTVGPNTFPLVLADELLDYLCNADDLPADIESVDGVDPVRE